jgi:hypothetical protein
VEGKSNVSPPPPFNSCDVLPGTHIIGSWMGPITSLEILQELGGGGGNRTKIYFPKLAFFPIQLSYIRLAVDYACLRLGLKYEVLEFKIGICQVVIPPPSRPPAPVTNFYEILSVFLDIFMQSEGQDRWLRSESNFCSAKFLLSRTQNCQKRLLDSSCLSFRPSVWPASVCPH